MRLYIDPGTGSMLFAILIGLIGAAQWILKGWLVKLRFLFSGGKNASVHSDSIPLAVFSDDKRYWSVMEPVCRELSKRNFPVRYFTASADDPALKCDYPGFQPEFIGEGNRAFAKLNLLRADILMATTPGLDVYQWKRSKDVKHYVHLLHAANGVTGYRMFGLDYYDTILLSGYYQEKDIRRLEAMRNLPPKELVFVGIPYMDNMRRRLLENPAPKNDIPIVLIAPSWGKSAIFSRFGGKIIDLLLKKTNYHIIVRIHPQSFTSDKAVVDKVMADFPASDRLEWNRDPDNFDVLNRSDILISDFSGIIFDYSLVYDKPLIFADTHFDDSPYDDAWLERPNWTLRTLPKIGRSLNEENFDQLPQLIETCLTDPAFAENRNAIREETWLYMDEGAARTADYLIQKHETLTKKEVSNQ